MPQRWHREGGNQLSRPTVAGAELRGSLGVVRLARSLSSDTSSLASNLLSGSFFLPLIRNQTDFYIVVFPSLQRFMYFHTENCVHQNHYSHCQIENDVKPVRAGCLGRTWKKKSFRHWTDPVKLFKRLRKAVCPQKYVQGTRNLQPFQMGPSGGPGSLGILHCPKLQRQLLFLYL